MSALSDALHRANVEGWSAREIARRSGDRIHFGTVAKYLNGNHGQPSEEVLRVFADVLRVPLPELRQLAGLPGGEPGPYRPPKEADRLDRRQRRVVDELIRMLAETKAGEEHETRSAPIIADRLTTPLDLKNLAELVIRHPKADVVMTKPNGEVYVIEAKSAPRGFEAVDQVTQTFSRLAAYRYTFQVREEPDDRAYPTLDWPALEAEAASWRDDSLEDVAARESTD